MVMQFATFIYTLIIKEKKVCCLKNSLHACGAHLENHPYYKRKESVLLEKFSTHLWGPLRNPTHVHLDAIRRCMLAKWVWAQLVYLSIKYNIILILILNLTVMLSKN